MAARTLKNEKDRLITLFVIGFMSCGARLPIYVLFAGAFFAQEKAGNILFLIYISGAILGLIMAKILKMFVFKGEDEPFVMEMPKYRMPKYPEIELSYQTQIEQSINEEKKVVLENELKMTLLEKSYLGIVGHATEPFFEPLGFDWRMAVALETGLAAKEVVVSTLGVLYALGDEVDEGNEGLIEQIRANIPFASAIAFIVFVMIYLPCLAASMVFTKEAGGWKYLVYLFAMTTFTAWILSFMAYNITKMFTGI